MCVCVCVCVCVCRWRCYLWRSSESHLLPPQSVTPHLFLSRATRYSLLFPPSHFEPALPPLYLPPLQLLLHPLLGVLVFLLLRGPS